MCLVARAPMTGSELVGLLRRYPLAGTGKSPGAVYPALHRLEGAGLLSARPRRTRSGRSRALRQQARRAAAGGPVVASARATVEEFGLSRAGVDRLRRWARRRVTRQEVLERPEHLLLRFTMCTGLAGPTAARRLARQCRDVCRTLATELVEELERARGHASPSARLALQCSLALLEARVAWARQAEVELARHARRRPELDLASPARDVLAALDRLPSRIRQYIRWPRRDGLGGLGPLGPPTPTRSPAHAPTHAPARPP